MSEPTDLSLDNCGCCEPEPTPSPLYNRPGLPALSYRSGIYATFFRRMLARLGTLTLPDGDFGGTRPLMALTTRSSDDPAIALLDASAIVADVLTFYQERIANEGFIRTAAERRSILEMARAIGYELNPGVAASAYLAFTLEAAPGAPESAEIPAGTKVQSVPPQGQLPQAFETSKTITARPEWNEIPPRLSETQDLTKGIGEIYLRGTNTGLKVGDMIFVTTTVNSAAAHIAAVEVDNDKKITHLTLESALPSLGGVPGSVSVTVWGDAKIPFDASTISENILQKSWTDSELNAFLQKNEWDVDTLVDYLKNYRAENPAALGYAYALRARAGIFGNNAPKYDSLPASQRFGQWVSLENSYEFKPAVYPNSWENRNITTDSQGNSLNGASFFLDRSAPAVVADNAYVVLENNTELGVYPINSVMETSLSDYGISAKVTGLSVTESFSTPALTSFKVRETTAYIQSELLKLAEKSLTTDLAEGTTQLELNGFFFGLAVGQAIALSGKRSDAEGLTQSEILFVKEINHNYGLTTLTFEAGLVFSYKRATVKINANVVPATHGETVSEILGNGNGAQTNQKFTLRKPPLTYTAASTPSGSASTLQLRVNNLLWNESLSLYELGPNDQSYTIRLDDDGKPTLIFGDGVKGARLPTGVNNVIATYRSGIGLGGQVEADSLTILQSKPLGVKSVTNPLPANGAGDPETMAGARANAPLTVRTLDRIVSREDYEDFAAAFAGIGKAQAVDLWSGEHKIVHLTIAGDDGKPITDPDFLKNFMDALDKARDPTQLIKVGTFSQLLFNLKVNLAVDKRYVAKDVFTKVETQLAEAFSFPKRGFGQGVTTAELITIIQKIAGVIFVDIDSLYLSSDSEDLSQILTADIAHVKNNVIQPAQLLLINAFGITLQEVKA